MSKTEQKKSSSRVSQFNIGTELDIFSFDEIIGKRFSKGDGQEDANARKQKSLSQDNNTSAVNNIISPKYDFDNLLIMYDISETLRAVIDAIAVNVSGFGFDIQPRIEIIQKENEFFIKGTNQKISKEMKDEIDQEFAFLEMFFKSVNLDLSWTELNERKLINKEIFGCSYFEWQRSNDEDRKLIGCNLVEGNTIDITKQGKPILVNQYILNPKTFEYTEQERLKKFRKYIQKIGDTTVYFKEYGDPRVMDCRTGNYLIIENEFNIEEFVYHDDGQIIIKDGIKYFDFYNSEKEIELDENFIEATELLQFSIYHPNSIHGEPRYISVIPCITGSRAASIVNSNLLRNNAIPPLAVIIEGYKGDDLETKIMDQLNKRKGTDSFTNVLFIEADMTMTGAIGAGASPVKPSIRIEPLADILTKDGMFLEYIKHCKEVILTVYRLAMLFVGIPKDINRSTAEVAKQLAEEQVFAPMRAKEDFIINEIIFSDLKIKYHKYKSKAGRLENPELISKIAESFSKVNAFTPNDVRKIGAELLNKELPEIEKEFMENPFLLTLKETSPNTPVTQDKPDNENTNTDNNSDVDMDANESDETNSGSNIQNQKLIKLDPDDFTLKFISNLLKIRSENVKSGYVFVSGDKQ